MPRSFFLPSEPGCKNQRKWTIIHFFFRATTPPSTAARAPPRSSAAASAPTAPPACRTATGRASVPTTTPTGSSGSSSRTRGTTRPLIWSPPLPAWVRTRTGISWRGRGRRRRRRRRRICLVTTHHRSLRILSTRYANAMECHVYHRMHHAISLQLSGAALHLVLLVLQQLAAEQGQQQLP